MGATAYCQRYAAWVNGSAMARMCAVAVARATLTARFDVTFVMWVATTSVRETVPPPALKNLRQTVPTTSRWSPCFSFAKFLGPSMDATGTDWAVAPGVVTCN